MLKFFCIGIKSANHQREILENNANNTTTSEGDKISGSGSLNSDPFLPDEIITEILSWLSMKALLRLKCVCKSWRATIQERNFIEKHKSRTKTFVQYGASNNGNENAYRWLHVESGLVLESSNLLPKKYRIRNIATKQKLDLPNPPGQPLFFSISFLSTSNDYKVVCINQNNEEATSSFGTAVLTIGTDVSWRSLDIPSLHYMKSQWEQMFRISIGEVFYIIGLGDYEIVCLEMETENFKSLKIQRDLFTDWNKIEPLNWRGKLALACVVGEKINIWVLESYKKQKWDNIKVVFPLDSIVKDPSNVSSGNLIPYILEGDWLWFKANDERQVAYNMRTNKVSTFGSAPPTQKIMYWYRLPWCT